MLPRKERLDIIRTALDMNFHKHKGIQLVIIDGVADLVRSANDELESVEVIDELYRLAGFYHCCVVWKHIQEVISVVTRYEAYFRSEMEQKLRVQSEETMRLCKKRLAQAEKRIGELDRLFVRIYEDNVAGKLDDERFAMMSKNYTEEQKDLKAEVKGLQQQIHEQEQQAENIEQFVQRVKRNSTLTELTPYALRELVKAVYVDAPDKSSGKRRQKVHIEYDLVGYIPVL